MAYHSKDKIVYSVDLDSSGRIDIAKSVQTVICCRRYSELPSSSVFSDNLPSHSQIANFSSAL